MLCYRCGSIVPDGTNKCQVCGQVINNSGANNKNAGTETSGKKIGPFKEGHLFADRYLIKELISIGTVGWLYHAEDQDMDIDVAIKVIHPKLLQTAEEQATFQNAAKKSRKIRHDNVMRIFDSGIEEGCAYYSMPYIKGVSLDKIISRRFEKGETFTLQELFGFFSQLAGALDAMQANGPICCIKPSHIIVQADQLKLTGVPNFQGLPHFPYVAMQQKRGTVGYMAPMAQNDQAQYGFGVDIYSMAVILGEMLTGVVASVKQEEFEQKLAYFDQPIRQAMATALSMESQARSLFNSAYDFLAAIFPEEVAAQQVENIAAHDEPTFEKFDSLDKENTVNDAIETENKPAEIPANENTKPHAPIAQAIVEEIEFPPVPQEEEMVLEADALEEEISAISEPKFVESIAVKPVDATALTREPKANIAEKTKVEGTVPKAVSVADAKMEAAFAAMPKANIVKPASRDPENFKTELVMRAPQVKKKESKGGIIAFASILLLGGVIGGAFWFINGQKDHAKQVVSANDGNSDEQLIEIASPIAKESASTDRQANKKEKADRNSANSNKVAVAKENKENKDRSQKIEKIEKQEKKEEAISAPVKENKPEAEAKSAQNAKPVEEAKPVAEIPKIVIVERKAEPEPEPKPADQKVVVKEPAKEIAPVIPSAASAEPPKQDTNSVKKNITADLALDKGASEGGEAGTCPADMILIPAGSFTMGTAATDPQKDFDDLEAKPKYVKQFCIDIYEYPNKEGAKPIQSLTYGQAQKHCQQKGKRLCKEEEWEKACKGPNGYRYPYGNRYSASICNTAKTGTIPSGQLNRCKSGYGLLDMAGNVAEWTSTKFDPDLPDRVYKGGGYPQKDVATRCSSRAGGDPNSHEAFMGVRCCKNAL